MATTSRLPRESFLDYSGNFFLRRSTFKRWPFQKENSICHPILMSLEWWRSSGDDDVNCIVCQKELEGWEETDHPFYEHLQHSKNCPVVAFHSFLEMLPEQAMSCDTEEALEQAYLKWVDAVEHQNCLESNEVSATVRGKRGRPAKKSALKTALKTVQSVLDVPEVETVQKKPLESAVKTALKTIKSVTNVREAAGMMSPERNIRTQRKQPQRQAKGTITKNFSTISVPNLATVVKKAAAKPILTFNELVQSLREIEAAPSTENIRKIIERILAAGTITNN